MGETEKELDTQKLYIQIAGNLAAITKNADKFLKAQPEICGDVRQLISKTYFATLKSDTQNAKAREILPELVVDEGMDEEQIWQQLELRNAVVYPQFVERVAHLMALREEKLEVHLDESDGEDAVEEDDDEEDSEDDEELSESEPLPKKTNRSAKNKLALEEDDYDEYEEDDEFDDEEMSRKQKPQKNKVRKSIVDDKFFKLSEMEAFLEQEDQKELNKQKGKQNLNDGFDYFAEDLGEGEEDSDEDNANYADFFDKDEDLVEKTKNKKVVDKKSKQKDHFNDEENDLSEKENDFVDDDEVTDDHAQGEGGSDSEAEKADDMQPASGTDSGDDSDEDDEEEEEETEEPKSSFEMREQRLQQRIREYEEVVLGEKPWQLRGEVKAANRPENSLLEEILEFESNVRPAPIITEATTQCLEDIIRQRIKDQAYDDVVRTVRQTSTPQDLRKQLVLDQEKSKQSLAQIYEKDYQRELDKIDPNRGEEEAEAESKEHLEIKKRMRELFIKLDALSNFHFTPKPVAPEPKIITNTPAVAMEEVAPVAVSDAKLLAPEEVYRGPKNGLLGKSERSRTDKNRERRKKKQKQRAIHQAIDARELERQKQGKPLSKKVEGAKLLKSITKHRNVQTITTSNDQGSLKSSKAFFNKLQDTTNNKSNVGGSKRAAKKPASDPTRTNAKKLKL